LDITLYQLTQDRGQLFLRINIAYSKNLLQIRMNYEQYYANDNLQIKTLYVLQILKTKNIQIDPAPSPATYI